MNKRQFREEVGILYDNISDLAKEAEQIIYNELEEHGDMDKEYLFGDNESDVWICDWEMIESISRDSDFDIWIGTTDKYGGEHHYYLMNLLPIDRIEVAEFLCRR